MAKKKPSKKSGSESALQSTNPKFAAAPVERGLPEISPDIIEQNLRPDFDNIFPTRGYQMSHMVALGGSAGGSRRCRPSLKRCPLTQVRFLL